MSRGSPVPGPRARVAIVHPWMPKYRLEFFQLLRDKGARVGIDVEIYYGAVPPEWRDRRDAMEPSWATKLATRFFKMGGRYLIWRSLAHLSQNGKPDLVVLEQAFRNLETYLYMAVPGHPPVAFWGHGRTYTQTPSQFQERVKLWLTRRGVWFFAYTAGGREAVVEHGFPANRVTVVWNTVSTRAPAPTSGRRPATPGPTALVLGALDQSKRLDFLLEALPRIHSIVPRFQVVFAGDGAQRDLVKSFASTRDWVRMVGHVGGDAKAQLLREARVIINPGRVGLVAADSIATGVPVATTTWPFHAPEFEYLTDGVSAVIAQDDLEDFVRRTIEVLVDDHLLALLSEGCRARSAELTTEAMADRFLTGIVAALAQGR